MLEMPAYELAGDTVVYSRTLSIGKSSDLLMRVAPSGKPATLVGKGALAEKDGQVLLHLEVFVVPHEMVGGEVQGGMCALPIRRFPRE